MYMSYIAGGREGIHYECRLGCLLFNTSPLMLLLVWYSLPTMYLFHTRLLGFAVFEYLHSLTYAIDPLKTNLDSCVVGHNTLTAYTFFDLTKLLHKLRTTCV
jgi:hypothetical protein